MKKLLMVALIATSFVGMVEAGRCGKNNCERPCEQKCNKPCIPAACIVGCENTMCEGEKPQLCALVPARVNVIKHVDTNISYSCADRPACSVIPSADQVNELVDAGIVPAGTQPCSR